MKKASAFIRKGWKAEAFFYVSCGDHIAAKPENIGQKDISRFHRRSYADFTDFCHHLRNSSFGHRGGEADAAQGHIPIFHKYGRSNVPERIFYLLFHIGGAFGTFVSGDRQNFIIIE
jgi:hypothetical protein